MPTLRLTRGTLRYEVIRRRRKTVGVLVRPDGEVEVHAPSRASQSSIARVLEEFRPWIEKKRKEARVRERRRRARRFDTGDKVPYLGRELTLEVIESPRSPPGPVRKEGSVLRVHVEKGLALRSRRAVVRYAVMRWLLEQSQEVFHRRHVRAARRVGVAACHVVIKDMKSRWGSCGPNRRMSLSWRLILAPLDVVDYVIVHELVHIHVPDHSPRFWKRVARACTHYAESRDWLGEHGDDLSL